MSFLLCDCIQGGGVVGGGAVVVLFGSVVKSVESVSVMNQEIRAGSAIKGRL